jgi:hypothetical protein
MSLPHRHGSAEAADRWAQRWGDLLRIKAEFPSNLWPKAVVGYHRWVRDAWRTAMPFDCFARELLTASGSAFTVPPANCRGEQVPSSEPPQTRFRVSFGQGGGGRITEFAGDDTQEKTKKAYHGLCDYRSL